AEFTYGLDVHAENDIDLGVFQYAFFNHKLSATFFTRRWTFFCRLKDEFHGPPKLISVLCQNLCYAHKYGNVCIMTTSVHHTGLHSCVCCRHVGLKGKVVPLRNGQCIHVSAQCDHRPGLVALQQTYYSGMRNSCPGFNTEGSQVLCYLLVNFGWKRWAHLRLRGENGAKESQEKESVHDAFIGSLRPGY